jgi:hypothetical protein
VVHSGGDADGRRRLVGPNARTIAIYFDGSDDPEQAEDGTPYSTTTSVVLVKSWWEPLGFTLPPPGLARNGTPRSTATTPPLPLERANATLVIR